jgi:uncharacterized protein YndB with AHSA1/START domain
MSNTTQATGPSLTIRRTFKAPRERVFAAFTDPALLVRWLRPGDDITMGDVAFDARVGGALRFVYNSPRMGELVAKGIVTALQPPGHLAYTWTWEEDDKAEEHESAIRIDFIDRGDETEVHFVHENLASVESRDRHEGGWGSALDNIARLFA